MYLKTIFEKDIVLVRLQTRNDSWNIEYESISNLVLIRTLLPASVRYILMYTTLWSMDIGSRRISTDPKILLVYYAYAIKKVIWFSIRDGEKKEYMMNDLRFLRNHMGYTEICSCTADGWVSISAAFKEIYPEAVLQRCLVHIQRQIKNYISDHPKSKAGRELKRMMTYATLSDRCIFAKLWEDWKTQHQEYINEKTIRPSGWWRYTHTKLKKAIAHINNALPDMFQSHHLNNPDIARSSNQLEWYFWVFADEWIKEHKWLSPRRLDSFIALWITFRNQK